MAKSKKTPAEDAPLKVEVVRGKLVISIGINTLAWASESANGGPLEGWRVIPGQEKQWAKDVADEMEYEDGDYNAQSRVGEWLDKMIARASDAGSGAQEQVKRK